MTIDSTLRKATFTGDGNPGQRVTALFAVEKEADVVVYDGDVLLQLTKDYTVIFPAWGDGFPTSTPNQFEVQLVAGTTNTVTVYRRGALPKQTQNISSGFQTKDMEGGFDAISVAVANSPVADSTSNIDLDGGRMQELGTPTGDTDASTTDYMQVEFSKKGKIAPPIDNTDNEKALYSDSETTVKWEHMFDVPTAPMSNKLLTVDWDGIVKWMDYPDFAPTLQNKPLFLSLDSGLEEVWRTINTLPITNLTKTGDVATWQPANNVALGGIGSLPSVPQTLNEHILGMSGGGSERTQSTFSNKVTYIQEFMSTTNNDTKTYILIKNRDNGTLNFGLLEWDLSSMIGIDAETFVSGKMVLDRTVNSGSESTVKVARLKTDFVSSQATWEESQTSTPWAWIDGASADVDLDMETYSIQVGTSTTGLETTDISALVLDAILNRSGILRILIYTDEPGSDNSTSKFGSDLGTNAPKIEVVTASLARQLKWKKSLSTSKLKCGGVASNHGTHTIGYQPHLDYTITLNAGHGYDTSDPLSIMTCAYASKNVCDITTAADIIAPHIASQWTNDTILIFPIGIQLTGLSGGGAYDNPNVSIFVYPEEDNI